MDVTLRPATDSDKAFILSLEERAEVKKRIGVVSPSERCPYYRVIERDDAPAGLVGVVRSTAFLGDDWEIFCVVHPDHRGRHVASQACKTAIGEWSDTVPGTRVLGCVAPDNPEGAGLARLLGFRKIAARPTGDFVFELLPANGLSTETSYWSTFLGNGTGTAHYCLRPILDAWAGEQGISLVPGTLNLCSDQPVEFEGQGISLGSHAHLIQPPGRRDQKGFSPRLYSIELNGAVSAWVYRWSDASDLGTFVGDADGCGPAHRVEVVSGVHLTSEFGLAPGDRVRLAVRA